MPNHVTSIMSVSGDKTKVKELLDFIANPKADDPDQRIFDFNKVLPMPSILGKFSAPVRRQPLKYLMAIGTDESMRTEEDRAVIRDVESEVNGGARAAKYAALVATAFAECGYTNWYDWCCDNWGTKWNCYEAERLGDDSISFQTAWTPPTAVLTALSERFPDVTIEVVYADEALFHNCGHMQFYKGEAEIAEAEDGSLEAFETVLEIFPCYEDEFYWNEETDSIESYTD